MSQLRVSVLISNTEFKRWRPTLPGWHGKELAMLLFYSALFFALSIYLFEDRIDHPVKILASGTALIWSMSCLTSFFVMLGFSNVPYREWWVTLPYPRQVLTNAKLMAVLQLMGRMILPVIVAGAGYYLVAVNRWEMPSIIVSEFIIVAIMFGLVTMLGTPIAATLGLLVSTLYEGRIRWVYIVPYLVVVMSSFSSVFIVQLIDVQSLTAINLLLFAIAVICIGWPLSYLLLRYITKNGMKSMANMSLISKRTIQNHTAGKSKKTDLVKRTKKSGWTALYELERTRYIHMSSLPLVRIGLLIVLVLVGIGAYFSAGKLSGVLGFVLFLVTLPLIVPNFWAMMVQTTEGQNKRIDWWLLFPHTRGRLLSARLVAIWVTALRFVTLISIVFWTVTMLTIIARGLEMDQLLLSFTWYLYGITLYMTALFISSGMVQLVVLTTKSMLHTILIFPLIFFVFYQTTLWINYFLPAELDQANNSPNWYLLLLLMAIGIPLAMYCMRVGAKHLNAHSGQVNDAPKLFKGN